MKEYALDLVIDEATNFSCEFGPYNRGRLDFIVGEQTYSHFTRTPRGIRQALEINGRICDRLTQFGSPLGWANWRKGDRRDRKMGWLNSVPRFQRRPSSAPTEQSAP